MGFTAVRFERGKPPGVWTTRIVIGLVMFSLASAWLGDLFLAAVIDREPLLLIALNPRNRNLAAASVQVEALPYYTVGFLRLVASDPLYFLLGLWYGDRALAWTKRRSRTYGPYIDDAGTWFNRFAYPLIFAAPNNVVCLLSGAFGIRVRTFMALNLSGTVVRLIVVRQFAEYFEDQVNWVVDLVARYRLQVFIVSAILVAWTIFGEFRGNDSEVKELLDLEAASHPEHHDANDPADSSPD